MEAKQIMINSSPGEVIQQSPSGLISCNSRITLTQCPYTINWKSSLKVYSKLKLLNFWFSFLVTFAVSENCWKCNEKSLFYFEPVNLNILPNSGMTLLIPWFSPLPLWKDSRREVTQALRSVYARHAAVIVSESWLSTWCVRHWTFLITS